MINTYNLPEINWDELNTPEATVELGLVEFFEIDCDELEFPNLIKKAYVPTISKDEDKMENYRDENEELKLYENGKKKMTMKEYLRIEKRFDKLRFHIPDLGNLDRRLEKLKP